MASLNTRRSTSTPQLPPQGGVAPARFEPSNTLRTHEGAPAARITPELALRRAVCSCLLWEDEFYESGKSIGDRIVELVNEIPASVVARLAIDARSHFNLRHVPLLLAATLCAKKSGTRMVGDTVAEVIQRADELSEFVAVYAKVNGVEPKAVKKKLSAQAKRGLALAFGKFDEYQLAKYLSGSGEANAVVRGRDVMFLAHPKPRDEAQATLFKRIAAKEPVRVGGADTWEVALSSGPKEEGVSKEEHKRATFERLLRNGKLGYLALLRNLRNMNEVGVDRRLVTDAILARRGAHRVLPFRYVAAARACSEFTSELDQALHACVADLEPLPGITTVLVDVSGSMNQRLSAKSDLTRMDAAATLAAVFPGDVRVWTFSNHVVKLGTAGEPPRGLSGVRQIVESQLHQGTQLGAAVRAVTSGDRLVVITDEQAHDHVEPPVGIERAYLINVASYRNGVGYGDRWVHLDGFSEQTLRFIREFERLPE